MPSIVSHDKLPAQTNDLSSHMPNPLSQRWLSSILKVLNKSGHAMHEWVNMTPTIDISSIGTKKDVQNHLLTHASTHNPQQKKQQEPIA